MTDERYDHCLQAVRHQGNEHRRRIEEEVSQEGANHSSFSLSKALCAADAETLDRLQTHDRSSKEDDSAECFAILHHQKKTGLSQSLCKPGCNLPEGVYF